LVKFGHTEIVELLKAAGADENGLIYDIPYNDEGGAKNYSFEDRLKRISLHFW